MDNNGLHKIVLLFKILFICIPPYETNEQTKMNQNETVAVAVEDFAVVPVARKKKAAPNRKKEVESENFSVVPVYVAPESIALVVGENKPAKLGRPQKVEGLYCRNYESNREINLEQGKAYYAENKEKVLAYKEANKDKIALQQRKYYEKRLEKKKLMEPVIKVDVVCECGRQMRPANMRAHLLSTLHTKTLLQLSSSV